ncbi:stage III sporulation protein AD [Amphibacillus indicireducens]|uniref:Stage III sporulation protein AD n=1 Tax=Amphibacillus indicireducens TaxID=1076330 RepID=A0ABP7VFS9_9BACI
MSLVQIILIGVVATMLITLIKSYQPTFALILLIVTSLFLFYFILIPLGEIIDLIRTLFNRFRLDTIYLETVFQVIGIAYLTELGSQLTNDAGLNSIASKIELVGKISILFVSIPVLTAIIETIIHLIPY